MEVSTGPQGCFDCSPSPPIEETQAFIQHLPEIVSSAEDRLPNSVPIVKCLSVPLPSLPGLPSETISQYLSEDDGDSLPSDFDDLIETKDMLLVGDYPIWEMGDSFSSFLTNKPNTEDNMNPLSSSLVSPDTNQNQPEACDLTLTSLLRDAPAPASAITKPAGTAKAPEKAKKLMLPRKHKCPVCNSLMLESELQDHIKSHERSLILTQRSRKSISVIDTNKSMFCLTCPFRAKDTTELSEHLEIHEREDALLSGDLTNKDENPPSSKSPQVNAGLNKSQVVPIPVPTISSNAVPIVVMNKLPSSLLNRGMNVNRDTTILGNAAEPSNVTPGLSVDRSPAVQPSDPDSVGYNNLQPVQGSVRLQNNTFSSANVDDFPLLRTSMWHTSNALGGMKTLGVPPSNRSTGNAHRVSNSSVVENGSESQVMQFQNSSIGSAPPLGYPTAPHLTDVHPSIHSEATGHLSKTSLFGNIVSNGMFQNKPSSNNSANSVGQSLNSQVAPAHPAQTSAQLACQPPRYQYLCDDPRNAASRNSMPSMVLPVPQPLICGPPPLSRNHPQSPSSVTVGHVPFSQTNQPHPLAPSRASLPARQTGLESRQSYFNHSAVHKPAREPFQPHHLNKTFQTAATVQEPLQSSGSQGIHSQMQTPEKSETMRSTSTLLSLASTNANSFALSSPLVPSGTAPPNAILNPGTNANLGITVCNPKANSASGSAVSTSSNAGTGKGSKSNAGPSEVVIGDSDVSDNPDDPDFPDPVRRKRSSSVSSSDSITSHTENYFIVDPDYVPPSREKLKPQTPASFIDSIPNYSRKERTYAHLLFDADPLAPRPENDCILCDQKFASHEALLEHRSNRYNDLQCCKCRFKAKSKEKLQSHAYYTHVNSCTYKCDVCGKTMKQRETFIAHILAHRGDYFYRCNVCDKGFQTYDFYEGHLNEHYDRTPFKCAKCDATFSYKERLSFHVRRAHKYLNVTVDCQICKKTIRKIAFTKHMSRFHPEKPKTYLCDVCGKSFGNNSAYKKHAARHSSERPHVCGYCGASFKVRSVLTTHEKKHTGERPYKCEVCDKTFTFYTPWLYHKRTHTGERPYKCNVCDATFAQPSPYAVHKRLHTGEKPYSCKICSKAFPSHAALRNHMQTHANSEEPKPKKTKKNKTESDESGNVATSRKKRKTSKVGDEYEFRGTSSDPESSDNDTAKPIRKSIRQTKCTKSLVEEDKGDESTEETH